MWLKEHGVRRSYALLGFLEAIHAVESVPSFFHASYAYAWFIGFGIAAAVYTLGMKVSGVRTT